MPRKCNHCDEFTRSHLLRQAAATAGNGLPPIEQGQPVPAGTGLNRRSFMLRSGAAMLSVYGASKIGLAAFDEGIANAAGGSEPVLVSVFLDGGADSLSLLAPTTDPKYRSLRPGLALPPGSGTAFIEDTRLRWHPAAAAFSRLHLAGKVSVLPSVSYAAPDQSHFTSRHYYEVGALAPAETTGWMGRLLDLIGTQDNPLQGLSLDRALSPALATAKVPVAAIDGYTYDLGQATGGGGPLEKVTFDAVEAIGARAARGKDAGRAAAGTAARQAIRVNSQLAPFSTQGLGSPVSYPANEFANALAGAAAMLAAGFPLRCITLSAPGAFDTHHHQEASFATDIKLAADALEVFQADLEARGLADRVITLVWSEFGRRPAENGSGGCDHGSGGSGFVIGTRVKGQMIGEYPGLDQLDEDDNLRGTSDFRALYCSVIEQWFGVDAGAVIPGAGSLARPALIE